MFLHRIQEIAQEERQRERKERKREIPERERESEQSRESPKEGETIDLIRHNWIALLELA